MKENPYSKLLNIIKEENKGIKSNIEIGEVVSASPLTIKIGDLQVDKDNILIADNLSLMLGDKIAVFPTLERQLYIIIVRLKEV